MEKTSGKNGSSINGLSLHYYTLPGDWAHKGSATQFGEAEWLITMKKAYVMDELVRKHGAIMDEYDPKRKVSLVVDEWGTWYDVEPGTNPGFLYQQNTLRDALVAGIHLNIFNNYCERVGMANIAQTVNVLQSVILTNGAAMVLTPTYHVFDMYQVHQDALKLPVYVESEKSSPGFGSIPVLSASSSEDDEGKIHVSITNIDPKNQQEVQLEIRGVTPESVTGKVITAEKMQDHNTFENVNNVGIKDFSGAVISRRGVGVTLPAKSVVTLEIK
jgi:alpha-N-arabinofuranosidase